METITPPKLTIPLLVRITPEDQDFLEQFAAKAGCTVPQLARYYIRSGLYKQINAAKESNSEE